MAVINSFLFRHHNFNVFFKDLMKCLCFSYSFLDGAGKCHIEIRGKEMSYRDTAQGNVI